MANENENQGGSEGRKGRFGEESNEEFGRDRQSETGQKSSQQPQSGQQSQQPQSGQQGSIGGQQGQQNEFGQQGEAETGLSQRTGQQGESGTGSDGAGFVGSNEEESGEYLQDRDPQQAGFAEQGRGAPEGGRDIERDGERTDNFDSDIEGSSKDR